MALLTTGNGLPNVVVTGFAMTTALATDAENTWKNLLDGQSGIRLLDDPFVEQYDLPVRIGGHLLEEFDSQLNKVENRRMSYLQKMATVLGRRVMEAYLRAEAARRVRDHWMKNGQAEQLVMSFHGVPERTLHLGDPYHCECLKTGRLLGEALQLPPERLIVSFQSRFGKAEWLKPYTQPTLEALARDGIGSVDVMCPGFVSDCLETLEEINMECREAFLHAGGKRFGYIPCLNERQDWIEALKTWPDPETSAGQRERDLLQVRSRDVLEHIERVVHHVRRLEQSVETAVQMHFSVQGSRTNDIMRTLTVLTAIFLPLNLITGFFGMNFDALPLIHNRTGIWIAVSLMVLLGAGLSVFCWRKRYLGSTRG